MNLAVLLLVALCSAQNIRIRVKGQVQGSRNGIHYEYSHYFMLSTLESDNLSLELVNDIIRLRQNQSLLADYEGLVTIESAEGTAESS